jgi:hypothetical protein
LRTEAGLKSSQRSTVKRDANDADRPTAIVSFLHFTV